MGTSNESDQLRQPSLARFQPTITLGNVVTFIGWCVFVIVGWTHLKDELDYLQAQQRDMQQTQVRMIDTISSLQQITAGQAALIQALHDRLLLDESYAEKHP